MDGAEDAELRRLESGAAQAKFKVGAPVWYEKDGQALPAMVECVEGSGVDIPFYQVKLPDGTIRDTLDSYLRAREPASARETMPAADGPLVYLGLMQPLEDGDATAEEFAAAPVVEAELVPMLEPIENDSELVQQPRSSSWRAPQTWKTHYVCTGINCGWSGSSRSRHKERRPNCPFMPCPMRFRAGEPMEGKVAAFLARCTVAQRQQGLPPDGERALYMEENAIAAVIPEGVGPGDTFKVLIERGATR